MPTQTQPTQSKDWLGIYHALVQHIREGKCCDELANEHLFSRQLQRMVGSTQLAIDENFGGDANAFHMQMYMKMAVATFEGEDPLTEIERWLNELLLQAGQLYN